MNITLIDAAVVRKNIEETKRFAELAHDIGAIGVKVRPNGIPKEVPEAKTLEQIGRSLRECGQQSQGYGVEIWLEVHGRDSNVPARVRRMMEIRRSSDGWRLLELQSRGCRRRFSGKEF